MSCDFILVKANVVLLL